MPLAAFKGEKPSIAAPHFIAPNAWLTGRVQLAPEVTILFGAALRGDIQRIIIGARSNIQDNAVVHTSVGLNDCVIGSEVTVGHSAIIHGAVIKDRCIIGMHSTVLDDAVVEEDCIIGANSLIPMGKVIPAGHLAFGSPIKVIRKLTESELQEIKNSAQTYVETGAAYRAVLGPGF